MYYMYYSNIVIMMGTEINFVVVVVDHVDVSRPKQKGRVFFTTLFYERIERLFPSDETVVSRTEFRQGFINSVEQINTERTQLLSFVICRDS